MGKSVIDPLVFVSVLHAATFGFPKLKCNQNTFSKLSNIIIFMDLYFIIFKIYKDLQFILLFWTVVSCV